MAIEWQHGVCLHIYLRGLNCDWQTDTTWTLAQSPIVISGQVEVTSSATLTIEPGVDVIFTGPLATIQVFGYLLILSWALHNLN